MDNLRHLFRGLLKTGHFWLVFFVLAVLVIYAFIFNFYEHYSPYGDMSRWGFGGPVALGIESESGSVVGISISPTSESTLLNGMAGGENFILLEGAAIVGISHPFSNVIPTRDGLKIYRVQEGDTLSDIASQFGITLETIRLANPSLRSAISPGQELIILPVTGIIYEIEEGDTLHGVAARYSIDSELIKAYNLEYQKLFESPQSIIILPYAKPKNRWTYINKYSKGLPVLSNYFKLPARGWNWGELHYYNAVDIAAACGEPVYTAAEGLVLEESGEGYWNDGYGNFILMEHSNGTRTRYAHTLENLVARGDYVLQGEQIALIGNTGNSDGPTGCHLHFEVYGAQNPFAVR